MNGEHTEERLLPANLLGQRLHVLDDGRNDVDRRHGIEKRLDHAPSALSPQLTDVACVRHPLSLNGTNRQN